MTDADAILQRVARRYANCRSYQDEGVVKLVPDIEDEAVIYFKTSFVRAGKFKFEWKLDNLPGEMKPVRSSDLVWFDGKHAYEQYEGKTSRHVQSLSLALHRASSGTLGASAYVPSLLLPNILPDSERLIEGPYRLEEYGENEVCAVLVHEEGQLRRELWIDKTDFFLRRISISGMTDQQVEALRIIAKQDSDTQKSLNYLGCLGVGEQTSEIIIYDKVVFDEEIAELALERLDRLS